MSAIPPELLHLLNSGQNPGQKSSNVGAFYLNDPQQDELMQDTENIRRSNKIYGQSQVGSSQSRYPGGRVAASVYFDFTSLLILGSVT